MTGMMIALLVLALAGGMAFFWEKKPVAAKRMAASRPGRTAVRTSNKVPGINLPALLQELATEMGEDSVSKAVVQDTRLGQALRVARAKNSAWFLGTSETRISTAAKNRVPMKRNSQTTKVLKQIEASYPAIKKSGGKVFICRQGVYLKKRSGQVVAIA